MRAGRPAFPRAPRQRGAALLLAMLIITLVATLAAGMVWQQWRAIQVETVERARAQATWILGGALDWARLILREDGKDYDNLNDVWATPLAEAKLSTFLAADKDNNAAADGIEAFLSGRISDAQARYNLNNLLRESEPNAVATEIKRFAVLCERIGLPADVATRIALPLRKAAIAAGEIDAEEASGQESAAPQSEGDKPVIIPSKLSELAWLGIEPEIISRLAPYVDILPGATPVNVNTASVEVLGAMMDPALAQRLVQERQRQTLDSPEKVKTVLGLAATPDAKLVSVASSFFEVRGRLRFEGTAIEERSLVRRSGTTLAVIRRERVQPEAAP